MTLHDETKTDQNVVPLGKAAKKAVEGLAEKTGTPTDLSQKPANSKTEPPTDKVKTARTAEDRENDRKRVMRVVENVERRKVEARALTSANTADIESIESLVSKKAFNRFLADRKLADSFELDDVRRDVAQMEMFQRETEAKEAGKTLQKKRAEKQGKT